jgi:transcriptional regulator NrdR family protein
MTTVIKRGGRKQNFMPSKIKKAISNAAREAGFSPSKREELVKEVGESVISFFKKKRVVKSTDIRKSIIGRLSRKSKSLASAWRRHEKRKKR